MSVFDHGFVSDEDHAEAMGLKIEELEKKLDEAIKVIEFYAKEDNWDDRILLILDDTEDTAYSSYNGGKRAREFLNKYKDEK